MTTSFSQYASKFLNARVAPNVSLDSSQPLFYSFQESEEGESSLGRPRPALQSRDDLELDEHGEPRLRGDAELEDPYLRLDEEEGESSMKGSVPMIASEMPSTQGGWLAHQTSPLPSRSPTPSPPSNGLLPPEPYEVHPPNHISLTESLLPRDGVSRSVFSLPHPGRTPRHRYNDSNWTILWCTALSVCFISFVLSFFVIKTSSSPPYLTLIRTIPLLTILTVLCACLSYLYIILLRYFARPVLIITTVFIPLSLVLSALSAFSGSFIYDGSTGSTWGSTVGLRLFSLVPLILALFTARTFLSHIGQINSTIGVVRLTARLLLANPPLLVLSPALLLVALFATLPFLSLVFRLLLVGYYGNQEWHVQTYATCMIVATCFIWIWNWCIVRGILRVTAAAAVGAWFFKHVVDAADPLSDQLQATRAGFARAWGPSIGTICLAALLQAVIGSIYLVLHGIRRLTTNPLMPSSLHPLSIPILLMSKTLKPFIFAGYTLPYAGLTGDGFFNSKHRVHEITSVKSSQVVAPSHLLIPTLLQYSSLSLSMLLALSSYLFAAHALLRPDDAPLSALLTGGISYLVFWFGGGILGDVADALYMCYCLDKEAGTVTQPEVFEAFEGPRHVNVV